MKGYEREHSENKCGQVYCTAVIDPLGNREQDQKFQLINLTSSVFAQSLRWNILLVYKCVWNHRKILLRLCRLLFPPCFTFEPLQYTVVMYKGMTSMIIMCQFTAEQKTHMYIKNKIKEISILRGIANLGKKKSWCMDYLFICEIQAKWNMVCVRTFIYVSKFLI